MLDADNYPCLKDLERIAKWDILTQGIDGLLALVQENTNWADRQIQQSGKNVIRYVYHTGGWSGNEDVIAALRRNFLFWSMFWEKSTKGGHYYFKIKKRQVFGWSHRRPNSENVQRNVHVFR